MIVITKRKLSPNKCGVQAITKDTESNLLPTVVISQYAHTPVRADLVNGSVGSNLQATIDRAGIGGISTIAKPRYNYCSIRSLKQSLVVVGLLQISKYNTRFYMNCRVGYLGCVSHLGFLTYGMRKGEIRART